MGFVRSLITGTPNTFRARAPVNEFEAQGATLDESDYAEAIRQAQRNALAVNPQQQALADALSAAASGAGPSVAENQLRQTTDQNVQQATGLIASQRGLNPALAARIAAKLGADANQRAAGDAATLRAQEQIAARGQLGGVLSDMASGATALTGTTGQLQTGQNTARIQNTLGTEQINAGVAAGNQQADLQAQGINAGVAQSNAGFQGAVIGGLLSGAGSVLGSALAPTPPAAAAHGAEIPGKPRVAGDSTVNDTVPILASPGEIVLPRTVAQGPDAPARAAEFVAALKAKKGGGSGEGYGRVLATTRALEERLARLERMSGGGEVKGKGKKPPADSDLGPKRDADLPAYQLPVYRGEAARPSRLVGKLSRRMADGGEVADPSLVDALRAWWSKEGDAEPEGRETADAINAKLPEVLSARGAVEAKRRQRVAMDAMLAGAN